MRARIGGCKGATRAIRIIGGFDGTSNGRIFHLARGIALRPNREGIIGRRSPIRGPIL